MKYFFYVFMIFFFMLLLPLDVNAESEFILPTDDAYVVTDLHFDPAEDQLRQLNTGDLDFLKVWYAWNITATQNQIVSPAYLQFDLSEIVTDEIKSATLRINVDQVVMPFETVNMGIFDTVNTNWTESDLVYDTAPLLTDLRGIIPITSPNWYKLDVTSMIKENIDSQISLGLFFPKLQKNSEVSIVLSSKESENPPHLVIEKIQLDNPIQSIKEKIIKIPPSDDAFILGDLLDSENTEISQANTGDTTFLRTGYLHNALENQDFVTNAYLKFDLTGFDLNNIESALLKMKTSKVDIIQDFVRVGLTYTDNQWSESELTFDNRPEITSEGVFVEVSSDNEWYVWDVTNLVNENLESRISFVLLPISRFDNSLELIEFFSKESTDESSHPYLEISVTELSESQSEGGGCLIATATFDSEMAPQVQLLREIRDSTVLKTQSGTAFMESFNQFYYSFSPTIADLQRQNPLFKEAVKIGLTPMLYLLSILSAVDIDSEEKMLGYGIGVILLNIGMYFAAPAILIYSIGKKTRS